MSSGIEPGLPTSFREELVRARRRRGWSQGELGRRTGLPQAHISRIEAGKVRPRFDTLLEIVRVLDHDLVLVPRQSVPLVRAIIADAAEPAGAPDDTPLFTPDEPEEEVS